MSEVESQLVAAGMTKHEARRKQVLVDRADAALEGLGSLRDRKVFRWWVPGRVELLGKHTDYAGGRSLLCAAERGICVAAASRGDDHLRVHDAVSGETVKLRLSEDALMETASQRASGHWSVYVGAVAQRLARNFGGPLTGADVVIASDLPQAAGMSSSSALVVAMFLVLARVNDIESRDGYRRAIQTPEQLAEYLGTIENGQSFGELEGERGVGTFGGSEDHTAILCSRAGKVAQYAFCSVRFERAVPFPADHVLVIATSGVTAEKTGAVRERYNRLSMMIGEILDRWQSATGEQFPSLAAAIDAKRPSAPRLDSDELRARLQHFVLESDTLIPAAADAIAERDLASLGGIVDQSQRAAEELLGNQIPETIFLAREARTLGATAASAFGAGFGGSVWALVRQGEAEAFRLRWADAYAREFPVVARRAEVFTTRAGPGVIDLN